MIQELPMVPKKKHARLSPSGADRWMICPGSVHLSKGVTSPDSPESIEGTDYHDVAAACLENGTNAADVVGYEMQSGAFVTQENADFLQEYLDQVRTHVGALNGNLLVEEECPLASITGEVDGFGTSDAVIIGATELVVGDLKFGRGVPVNARGNRQVRIYAIGVIEKHQLWDTIDTVRTFISQPRIQGEEGYSECVYTIAELKAFRDEVSAAAKLVNACDPENTVRGKKSGAVDLEHLHPEEKACRWCPVKATCPALRKVVGDAMILGFKDEDGIVRQTKTVTAMGEELGAAMDLTGLAETWLTAVRAKVETELLSGRDVVGKDGKYKLVLGRKGNREWIDEEKALALMRDQLKLTENQTHTKKLVSPAALESLCKTLFKKKSTEQYGPFATIIKQGPAPKSVASPLDPRPAISIDPSAGFVDEEPELKVEDLL